MPAASYGQGRNNASCFTVTFDCSVYKMVSQSRYQFWLFAIYTSDSFSDPIHVYHLDTCS